MTYSLPKLPYEANSLAPAISERTIDFHYGKHEKAYIDNLNTLIKSTEFEDEPLEEIIRRAEGPLFNNASQAWNHIFYFFSFSPDGGGEPTGELAEAIRRDFGSFKNFKEEFEKAGASIFGSGWVWLARDDYGYLQIISESNAGNPLRMGLTPLLTFDVWEHAYYLDHQNRRLDALRHLWSIIDWDIIESRF